MNRIKCETCQRWSHLGCTFLTSSDKNALSRTYFCTVKCELQSLPFYTVKNEDLDIFVKQKRQHGDCKIVPQHKRKNKFSEIDYSNKKPTTCLLSVKFLQSRQDSREGPPSDCGGFCSIQ